MNRHELKEKCRALFGKGKGTSWIEIAPNAILEAAIAEGKPPVTSYVFEGAQQPAQQVAVASAPAEQPAAQAVQVAPDVASAEELIKKATNMLSALKTRQEAPAVKRDPLQVGEKIKFMGMEFPIIKTKRPDLIKPIDPTYCWDKKRAQKIALALATGQRLFLVGPRGCGKSSIVDEVCANVRRPCLRVNLHGDVMASTFVGEKTIDNQGKIVFAYGVLPQCMRDGVVLILDELPSAPSDIMLVLQRVAEGGPLVLMENGGEIIEPAPGFQIFATGNDALGDQQGIYTACKVMDASTLDRYHGVLHFDYMSKKSEKTVLSKKHPSLVQKGDLLDRLVELASQVRKARKNGDVTYDFSMRRLVSFCKFCEERQPFYSDDKSLIASCAEDAIIGLAGEGDRPKLADLVQRHFDVQTQVESVAVEVEGAEQEVTA